MAKIRGIKIRNRLIRVSEWIIKKYRIRPGYQSLGSSPSPTGKPIMKLITWGRKLAARARSICHVIPGSGYIPVGSDPVPYVPKGHLAVYVGQKDGQFHRALVPVIYFNHPLFRELLREAEMEYGFQHPGGITIPCPLREFERVKARISSGSRSGGSPRLKWRH